MTIAVFGIAALVLGMLWMLDYRLGANAVPVVIGAHAVIAIVATPLVAWGARRLCSRRSVVGALLAALAVFGIVPVLHAVYAPPALAGAARLALIGGSCIVAIGIALLVARAGAIASALALAAAGAGCWIVSPPSVDRLPAWPTRTATPQAPLAGRVAVIGWDGADWRVADPLIARGELPSLARLRAGGVHGVLESIDPMYSPVVWSSIFSGKRPEKHGISGWYTSHAANRQTAMLWDAVQASGLAPLMVNVPGSWPPQELARGEMISGFPMPSPMHRFAKEGDSSLVGRVAHGEDRHGTVPTTIAERASDGAFVASMKLGHEPAESRLRLRHWLLEFAILQGRIPLVESTLAIRLEPAGTDGRQRVTIGEHAVSLAPGEWSPWISHRVGGSDARLRARRLANGGLFVTPPFQDPAAPAHAFTSSAVAQQAAIGDGMYVIEATGWRAADDADVRDALFEHLVDVEEQHLGAALRLLDAVPDWKLLAHVITITDRVSHGYWRFHEPEPYAPLPGAELDASRSRVEDAYRRADVLLGRLLDRLGPDVTVLVVSDHGFQAEPSTGHGNHRKEGIVVAAGPGIRAASSPISMSVLDVTPTVLRALGLPVGGDMDGIARAELFAGASAVATIPSWDAEGAAAAASASAPTQIDSSTEEQLRSLGYVE